MGNSAILCTALFIASLIGVAWYMWYIGPNRILSYDHKGGDVELQRGMNTQRARDNDNEYDDDDDFESVMEENQQLISQ